MHKEGAPPARVWKKRWFKNTFEQPLVLSYYQYKDVPSSLKGTVDLKQVLAYACTKPTITANVTYDKVSVFLGVFSVA
ncbi:hypothetical protein Pelo_5401 [Pelomyxa schiedti]|nr:hypothetical protein Pelo_5401 [Pelomyxa schiedti]